MSTPTSVSSLPRLDYKATNKKKIEVDAALARLVLSFYAIPGQDATFKMRLKDIPNCGLYGPFVDLAMRSCVNMIIIRMFECDISALRAASLDLFRRQKTISLVCKESFDKWERSIYCSEHFVKYITDARGAIMSNWLLMLTMRPMSVLQNSLHNFVWSSNILKQSKYDESLSIFGIKG